MSSTNQLSKAEEKAMLAKMIEKCPEGYVKTILSGVQIDIENAISNDFGFITLKERYAEMLEHLEAVAALRQQESALKATIGDLERRRSMLEDGLNELRSTIRQYARI